MAGLSFGWTVTELTQDVSEWEGRVVVTSKVRVVFVLQLVALH